MVTLAQLQALGLTRAAVEGRVRRGRLLRLYRGVYAVGHRALTEDGRLIAAVYACGGGAVLSHRSAGVLLGLLRSSGSRIDVTVPTARKSRDGITLHTTRAIHADDRTVIAGIPTTTIARTLVDLADVLSEERLTKAVHRAEILRVFDLTELEGARARPGPHGQAPPTPGPGRLPPRASPPAQQGGAPPEAALH